ncbi:MAG: hypothetical protein LRS43_04705 [Desulfurococcales archaeon]|nr:hypothetical protein [Desulfurococcales archaeon]
MKAIAEVTGLVLTGLVTLAIATAIFIAVAGQLSEISEAMNRAATEAEAAPREKPVILSAEYNSTLGEVWVSVASSTYPVTLVDAYINGALATPSCTVTIGGSTTGLPRDVPANAVALVKCSAPTGLSQVEVRIAYEGISSGLVVAYAG